MNAKWGRGSPVVRPGVYEGSVDPEGAIAAPAGSLYLRANGWHYRKAAGSGVSGWVAVTSLVEVSANEYEISD